MSPSKDLPSAVQGSPLLCRFLGLACFTIAVAWLVAIGVMVEARLGRSLIEVEGRIHQIDTGRATRPSGIALFSSRFLTLTLREQAVGDGPYRPEFRYVPPFWARFDAGGLADLLAAGTPVRLTVEQPALARAMADLAERHRLEQSGGVYNPGPFVEHGVVEILVLAADGLEVSENPKVFTLALALCFFAAVAFGAAGLALYRSEA